MGILSLHSLNCITIQENRAIHDSIGEAGISKISKPEHRSDYLSTCRVVSNEMPDYKLSGEDARTFALRD